MSDSTEKQIILILSLNVIKICRFFLSIKEYQVISIFYQNILVSKTIFYFIQIIIKSPIHSIIQLLKDFNIFCDISYNNPDSNINLSESWSKFGLSKEKVCVEQHFINRFCRFLYFISRNLIFGSFSANPFFYFSKSYIRVKTS